MDATKRNLLLGALLHDIGKLVRRATQQRETHSSLGYDYIKENLRDVDQDVLDCIRYHHAGEIRDAGLDKSSIAYIVYEADNISSGMDRRPETREDIGGAFRFDTPLHSIFGVLNDTGGTQKTGYEKKKYSALCAKS